MQLKLAGFLVAAASLAMPAAGAPIFFSTGDVDGRMAMASRPSGTGVDEIEAADDFTLTTRARLNNATFTGLLPAGSKVTSLTIEIYRVFPLDSVDPPSGRVPTRMNSPSDVALDSRTSGSGLNFSTSVINPSFTAMNSVLNGINPIPNQTTGGEGSVSGEEVLFNVDFTSPFFLAVGHYFFIPQVQLDSGQFFWLSSVRPIVTPGTPFMPDLQAWIRNEPLAPDWLRVGTDIVGGSTPPTFNAAFTLNGEVVPEPSTTFLLLSGGIALLSFHRIRHSRRR
jgi:hypothetical protein